MIVIKWIKKKWNDILNYFAQRQKLRKIKWTNKRKEKANKNLTKLMTSSKKNVNNNVMGHYYNDIDLINIDKRTNVLDVDLIDDNLNSKDKKKLRQYTKIIISLILVAGIIWITWSYTLATIALIKFGSFQPLESLSAKVCAVVISSICSYSLKAFAETFFEKKNEIDLMKINNDTLLNNIDDDVFVPGTSINIDDTINSETDDAVG